MTIRARYVVIAAVIVVAVVLSLSLSSIFTGNQLSDPNMLDAIQSAAATS
jgi:hypothetical protein